MLRITASTSSEGAKQYFGKSLTRSDYYIDGQEIAGLWHGKGAERLGLSGEVDAKSYFALCDNLDPNTGEQLTPRSKDNRRVGYDFTFSAEKKISVTYELTGDQRILEAFRDSVNETMREIETEMKTRVRMKGADVDRVTGNMAWAEFVHFTSRPVNGKPDPHLHAHCFAFNSTFDEKECRWKAGQFGDLKRDAGYYEAAFHARFADRLNALGYQTEKKGTSFTLANLPESITDKFSQRRNLIEKIAAEKGIASAEGKHAIGRKGRENKTLDRGKKELRDEWRSRLTEDELEALLHVARDFGDRKKGVTAEEALGYAIDHSFERVSTIEEKRLRAEALRYGVGSVTPEDLDRVIRARKDLIRIEKDGELLATTRGVLSAEISMINFARDGRGQYDALAVGGEPHLPETLNAEQGAAADKVLNSRDRVIGILGGAGTGKTTTLKAIVAGIEQGGKSGKKVFAFAPSAQASRKVLKDEGFDNPDTLAGLFAKEELQAKLKGQVILVDEAGMVGSKDMGKLFKIAAEQNARVILSGDYRQHGSVPAGDAFRLLEKEAGVHFAELRQIRRQTGKEYKAAVTAISKGTKKGVLRGFDQLDSMGAIVQATGEERHKLLVSDYLNAVEEKRTALIIAPTHKEGDRLTEALRSALKERGDVGEKERSYVTRRATQWTEAQRRDARNYENGMVVEFYQNVKGGFARGESAVVTGRDQSGRVTLLRKDGTRSILPDQHADRFQVFRTETIQIAKGDRVRIRQNGQLTTQAGKKVRVNNGDIETVAGFRKDGGIELAGGKVVPAAYGHIGFGYVDTSHASQGKTVDRVFIATGNESLRAANQQQWYVSVSRAKESARIYVDNKDFTREAIQRSGERLSAIELVKHHEAKRPKLKLHERVLERSRVARYFKTRVEALANTWRDRVKRSRGNESRHHG